MKDEAHSMKEKMEHQRKEEGSNQFSSEGGDWKQFLGLNPVETLTRSCNNFLIADKGQFAPPPYEETFA